MGLLYLLPLLISIRGWVEPRTVVQPEGVSQLKIPITQSGIEPATFRRVALCLTQLRHPTLWRVGHLISFDPPLLSLRPCFQALLLTYLLHGVLLEKLTGYQLLKKFLTFYGTRSSITAFTSACHLSLSRASPIQSIPIHSTSRRSIFILNSHLRLRLPSGLFPSCFRIKPLYAPCPLPSTCYMLRSSHFSWFDNPE